MAPTTRVPTAVVGRVAPGGQLPLTWPRHTGPPRAPTRGSRGGLALPSPDTRERRGVGNSNWSPPTARALILLDAITFSLSLSLSLSLPVSTPRGPRGRAFSSRTRGFRLRRTDTRSGMDFFPRVDDSFHGLNSTPRDFWWKCPSGNLMER